MSFMISASVITDDPDQVARVVQCLGLVGSGLALEGLGVTIHITSHPDGEYEEEEEGVSDDEANPGSGVAP
jgi:hypothetical protein